MIKDQKTGKTIYPNLDKNEEAARATPDVRPAIDRPDKYKPGFEQGISDPPRTDTDRGIMHEPPVPARATSGAGPAVEDFVGSPAPHGINSDGLTAADVNAHSNLTQPERDMLRKVNVERMPVAEVAAQHHVSEDRVRAVVATALKKMGRT